VRKTPPPPPMFWSLLWVLSLRASLVAAARLNSKQWILLLSIYYFSLFFSQLLYLCGYLNKISHWKGKGEEKWETHKLMGCTEVKMVSTVACGYATCLRSTQAFFFHSLVTFRAKSRESRANAIEIQMNEKPEYFFCGIYALPRPRWPKNDILSEACHGCCSGRPVKIILNKEVFLELLLHNHLLCPAKC